MSNEISQEGIGNNAFQNVKDSTINITQQLGKSVEFQELIEQLDTQKELLSYISESNIEKRLPISKKINDLEKVIERFKKDVLRLAKEFSRIEINTDRLKRAKEYFDNGKFDKSLAVLESNIDEIVDEQTKLIEKREDYEKELIPKLKHSADEFLILALSKATNYKNLNRYSETCEYFELSLKSFESYKNTFLYANFLAHLNDYVKAKECWEKSLNYFSSENTASEKVELLNNLAIAYSHSNEYDKAKEFYEKALKLGREIEKQEQTEKGKSFIAYVLNNYGNFLTMFSELDEAENKLIESLNIRKVLTQDDSVESLNNVAFTSLNLGVTYLKKEEYERAESCFNESLYIFTELINEMPFYALQQIALIKNNLGDLYWKSGFIEKAAENFTESVELYISLVNIEPSVVAPFAVLSLSNLALFHQGGIIDKEKSIQMAFNAIILALPIMESMEAVAKEFDKARLVLINWGMTDEEIGKWVDDAMNELSEDV